jgi:hypothetical protein
MLGDRVGHHHGREQFTELASQQRLGCHHLFERYLGGWTAEFGEFFNQSRQQLLVVGRQERIDGADAGCGDGGHA